MHTNEELKKEGLNTRNPMLHLQGDRSHSPGGDNGKDKEPSSMMMPHNDFHSDSHEDTERLHASMKPVTLDPKRPARPFIYVVALIAAMGGLLFGFDIGGSGGTFLMPSFREKFGWPPNVCCNPVIGPLNATTRKPLEYCMRYGCLYRELDCLAINTTYNGVTYNHCDPDAWDMTPNIVANEQGWITSLFSIGCFFGALPSGSFADYFGRKRTIIINTLLFCVGAGLQAASTGIKMMYIGRVVGGFAIGVLSNVVTMYQSEMAPDNVRGMIVTLQQLGVTFGIVMAASLNIGLRHWSGGWRFAYGGNIIIAIIMALSMSLLPDSPRWLVHVERYDEARMCLHRVRYEDEIATELRTITKCVEGERILGEGTWMEVFAVHNNMRYRVFMGCALQFLQQMSGINTLMFFAPSIINTFFGYEASLYGNFAIQVINCICTFICIYFIDRIGRVSLLLVGGLGMTVSLVLVTILFSPVFNHQENESIGILIIMFSCAFVCCFAFSWGPIPWVMCSEIYPQNLRGKCTSLSTATNWIMTTVVGKVTPIMYQPAAWGLWGTFLYFTCWSVIMTVFTYLFVPETSNILLEDTDQLFDEFKVGIRRKKTSLNLVS